MRKLKTWIIITITSFSIASPNIAKADFWGGDLIYLAQILDYAIRQYEKLQKITKTGQGTLDQLKEINAGLKKALALKKTLNRRIQAGVFSDINDVTSLVRQVEDLYGRVPKTSQAKVQRTTDVAIAEGIHLHNQAFKYADELDPMAEELKSYGSQANQKSAIRANVQGQGMIIHVLNQILRTNAALLKMQSQNLAMQNRRSKAESAHFRRQYKSLGEAFGGLDSNYDLAPLRK